MRKKFDFRFVCLFLLLGLALFSSGGCGGGGGGESHSPESPTPGAPTLTGIQLSDGILSPAFTPATTQYTADVANSVASLMLTSETANSDAQITVNGAAVLNGSASGPIPLNVGANIITVIVTNTAGSATYTLTVTRAETVTDSTEPGYDPVEWSDEDILYMTEHVVDVPFEELIFEDGTSIKEYLDTSASSRSARANDVTWSPAEQKKRVAQMIWRAVELTKEFPVNDPKRAVRSHGDLTFGQNKLVYVYPSHNNDFGNIDNLQTQYQCPSGKCEHKMYGVDCVGFVIQSAKGAGIDLTYTDKDGNVSPAVGGGENDDAWPGLYTPSNWQKVGFSAPKSISQEERNKTFPNPGDILVWEVNGGYHVGIAVHWKGGVGVAHSNKGGPDYRYSTCGEYQYKTEHPEIVLGEDGRKTINGPLVSEYDLNTGVTGYAGTGKEDYRIRLMASPLEVENWADSADTSWYDNAPLAPVYTITTAEQLAGLAELANRLYNNVTFKNKTINLGANIDLGGAEWTPIATINYLLFHFGGTFDGRGHTISNMTITEQEHQGYIGLFGNIDSIGGVKNVNLTNVHINVSPESGGGVGSVVGYLNYGTVSNCTFSGSISQSPSPVNANNTPVGGIVGMNRGIVTDCKSDGDVSSTTTVLLHPARAGGIVGYNYGGTVMNCHKHSGRVSGAGGEFDCAGGIIGYSYYPLSNISGNTFSRAATGQEYGIGWDPNETPRGPSNDGATPID